MSKEETSDAAKLDSASRGVCGSLSTKHVSSGLTLMPSSCNIVRDTSAAKQWFVD